jgi:hypothetical protein
MATTTTHCLIGLENDNQYNEFQSDSSASDNTANAKNTNLKAIINNKLAACQPQKQPLLWY